MLRNVLVNYLGNLTVEREFDVPFMCILLKDGFYDIHFLHGTYEFGKDFIAKREENGATVQYAFQSKQGNITQAIWSNLRGQLDELRLNPLGHPNFSRDIPKKFVLVTTGELRGQVGVSAQQFDELCKRDGHLGFEVWDQHTLIEKMLGTDPFSTGLREDTPELLQLLGSLRQKQLSFSDIENYSIRWVNACGNGKEIRYLEVILEAALLVHELQKTDRTTLACFVSLLPLRAILSAFHTTGVITKQAKKCIQLIRDMFAYNVENLIVILRDGELLTSQMSHPASFITYPVLCSHVIELLGLYGYLQSELGATDKAEEVVGLLTDLIQTNPGYTHPISDKYAVSFISPILLLSKSGRLDLAEKVLRDVTIWVCDRYSNSEFGLASPDATEEQEVATFLGYAFDFVHLPKRTESYLATVLLDLMSILGLEQLYSNAVNDILACGIHPSLYVVNDSVGQYVKDDVNASFCPNLTYKEDWDPAEGWKKSTHHSDTLFFSQRQGFRWESLILPSILRDRHHTGDLRNLYIT